MNVDQSTTSFIQESLFKNVACKMLTILSRPQRDNLLYQSTALNGINVYAGV